MSLKSLSLFIGTGQCNANCAHCAGVPLRKSAPLKDGIVDKDLIYETIKRCHKQGARYLSISSGGEPTLSPLSVTKTLELIYECRRKGIKFSPINLYSNGIRIGQDKNFADKYLAYWKGLGLTAIYVTVHDINEKENARIYRIKKYPSLKLVTFRIHQSGLLVRANLVLNRQTIGSFKKFVSTVESLKKIGVDYISAWPIRDQEDKVDKKLSPSEKELDKIENWLKENQDPKCGIRLLREKSRKVYQNGQKLTLFPDGSLTSSWCN
jgi:wyosine [tRNA(Phe)-imidazoG37] synthetase (radical SAM superfamily)